jgi:hypothetical protein
VPANDCSSRTEYLRYAKAAGPKGGNRFEANSFQLANLPLPRYAELQREHFEKFQTARAAAERAMVDLIAQGAPRNRAGALDERWFSGYQAKLGKATHALRRVSQLALELELGNVRPLE